jgi:hypothetical protein
LWRRYICLWINYALFEELEAEDVERTRQVYRHCLELLPHKHFTFAKIWLLYAKFEIKNKNLTVARKSLVWCYLKLCSCIAVVVAAAMLGAAAVVWCYLKPCSCIAVVVAAAMLGAAAVVWWQWWWAAA